MKTNFTFETADVGSPSFFLTSLCLPTNTECNRINDVSQGFHCPAMPFSFPFPFLYSVDIPTSPAMENFQTGKMKPCDSLFSNLSNIGGRVSGGHSQHAFHLLPSEWGAWIEPSWMLGLKRETLPPKRLSLWKACHWRRVPVWKRLRAIGLTQWFYCFIGHFTKQREKRQ